MLLVSENTAVLDADEYRLEAHEYRLVADEFRLDDDASADRRRGLRVRDERPVKVFEPAGARYYGGRTEDISATGLRIELPAWAPLQAGDELNIHVGLNGRGQTLANRRSMIPARVVWVHRASDGRQPVMEAGVEFLNTIHARVHAA
jgi:hypothetical protein